MNGFSYRTAFLVLLAAFIAHVATIGFDSRGTPEARGESGVGGAAGHTLVTGRIAGQPDADALYVFRHGDQKLMVFLLRKDHLELAHVRNCEHDFQVEMFSGSGKTQSPQLKKP